MFARFRCGSQLKEPRLTSNLVQGFMPCSRRNAVGIGNRYFSVPSSVFKVIFSGNESMDGGSCPERHNHGTMVHQQD